MMSSSSQLMAGFVLILAGFLLVLVGTGLGSGASGSSEVFILIGPVPIVFGSGQNSGMLALVGLAITLVVVVFYLVSFLRWRSGIRDRASE